MDSPPVKKSRLSKDSQNNILRNSDSAFCEETNEPMDVCINEKESDVCLSSKVSCSDVPKSYKNCPNNEIPEKVVDTLFQRFWMATDRKLMDLSSDKLVPSKFHLYGLLNKIKNRSPTLNNLTHYNLENVSDFKVTLIKVLEELGLVYDIIKLETLPNKTKLSFAFDIKSTPALAFCGLGKEENMAVNAAAKKGLAYFIAISQ